MTTTEPPIVVQQQFPQSESRVWRAVTSVDEMRQWFFPNINSFAPVLGGKSRFLVENEGRQFTHLWEIIAVDSGRSITYDWRYEEHPGVGKVTFAIENNGSGCILKLTNEVIEDFPQDIPEFKRQSGIDGWNYLIKESLVKYLKG